MFGPFVFGFQDSSCADRRGKWNWDFSGDWGGGPQRGRGHWRGRAARLFEQGDLKYVILRLLEEKPRHGYEIIKDLESRFGGSYAPSPGTVYPTLTMLEDIGYARVIPEDGGKKIYEITDEGRKYLAEHSSTVNDIFDRISRFVGGFTDTPMMQLNEAFRELAKATYKTATSNMSDKDKIDRIKEIIQRAAAEIDGVAK